MTEPITTRDEVVKANTKSAIDLIGKRVACLTTRVEFGGDALKRIDAEIENYKASEDFGKFAASDRLTLVQFNKAKKSVATAMQKDRIELKELEDILGQLKGSL